MSSCVFVESLLGTERIHASAKYLIQFASLDAAAAEYEVGSAAVISVCIAAATCSVAAKRCSVVVHGPGMTAIADDGDVVDDGRDDDLRNCGVCVRAPLVRAIKCSGFLAERTDRPSVRRPNRSPPSLVYASYFPSTTTAIPS